MEFKVKQAEPIRGVLTVTTKGPDGETAQPTVNKIGDGMKYAIAFVAGDLSANGLSPVLV